MVGKGSCYNFSLLKFAETSFVAYHIYPSWRMFCACLIRVSIRLMMDGMFFICLNVFLCVFFICLYFIYIIWSKVWLKSSVFFLIFLSIVDGVFKNIIVGGVKG